MGVVESNCRTIAFVLLWLGETGGEELLQKFGAKWSRIVGGVNCLVVKLIRTARLGDECEEAVQQSHHEVANSSEQVGEERECWSEVLSDGRVTVLVGERDEGVDGAVNIVGNSDLVAADKSEDFDELGWSVQEDETRHVGDDAS